MSIEPIKPTTASWPETRRQWRRLRRAVSDLALAVLENLHARMALRRAVRDAVAAAKRAPIKASAANTR